MPLSFHSPIDDAGFLDARTRQALDRAGFSTVGRLLTHYPFRYEDRRRFDRIPQEAGGDAVCLHGIVTDLQFQRMGFKRGYVKVTVQDAAADGWSQPLVVRFFHMPFLMKSFAVEQQVILYGKLKASGRQVVMDHPEFEIVGDDAEEASIHLQRIVPIYRDREGLPLRTLRRAMHELLAALSGDEVPDILRKPSARGGFAGMSRWLALRGIHFPEDFAQLDAARSYLALEEFFGLQINVLRRRREWDRMPGGAHCGPGRLLEQWQQQLPFPLTGAQQRAIEEIRRDLAAPRPMHRLLQGDVGSGKTFVALAAMLLAVESGCQAALMAPTQILAEQHYLNFCRWLEPLGIRVALRTGSRKEEGFLALWSGTEAPQIFIGTHALISESMQFADLGLVVIDEQHKFGVQQRSRLIRSGATPDVLVMTATPIPRTLTLTVYGDLDVSVIDEMPAGRGQVHTAVREQPDLAQVAAFLRQQVESGRQAYLVYPLVEETDALKLKAATQEVEAWRRRLAPIPTGLVHGRLDAEEKAAVMRDFRSGELKVLVATSVIEVGVDVPNATVMVVFEAERFGLAQLHQLRGRIGRGEHRSWCVLVASGQNAEALARLRILETTTDGFAVAEEDLKLRGPGDLLGTAQSGLPGLQLGDLVRDQKLVQVARQLATEVLEADPEMEMPHHRHLKALLLSDSEAAALG
ncbi:MAG: ATP-dependent DNA helicase RecG [Verrucomicrobiales bacterium]|nr:ATP-dependent DNA helicase RecG [Verrucomicrobiales bacterium]